MYSIEHRVSQHTGSAPYVEDAISERDEDTNVIIMLKTANAIWQSQVPGIALYIMPHVQNPLKPHVQK